MMAYLAIMAPRLVELRRVLKPTPLTEVLDKPTNRQVALPSVVGRQGVTTRIRGLPC